MYRPMGMLAGRGGLRRGGLGGLVGWLVWLEEWVFWGGGGYEAWKFV